METLIKEKPLGKLLKVGLLIFVVSLSILMFYLSTQLKQIKKNSSVVNENVNPNSEKSGVIDNSEEWIEYSKSDFGFSLMFPPDLVVNETKDIGGYKYFVRFEEDGSSSDKGIGVGVSVKSLEAEINKIKDSLEKEGGKLIEEKDVVVNGFSALQLYFKPQSSTMEERVVVILSDGKYAYSISTTPDQVDRVLQGFKLNK